MRTGTVCVALAALGAAVACSSDDDSSPSPGGEGGEAGSSGAAPSTGGRASSSGGAPGDGGSGEQPAEGGNGSGAPGDFSSVWQAASVELLFFDAANPTGFESRTFDMPAAVEGPGGGREVELYVQFEGESRITYAYTDGDPAYYRFAQPAYGSEDFYSVSSSDGVHSYTIEDGKLVDMAQQAFGEAWGAITTTYYEKVDVFPPRGWPSKFVSYELEGAE